MKSKEKQAVSKPKKLMNAELLEIRKWIRHLDRKRIEAETGEPYRAIIAVLSGEYNNDIILNAARKIAKKHKADFIKKTF